LIDRNLLIASLNAQVPARDYLASFVKSDRLLGEESSSEPVAASRASLTAASSGGSRPL